MGPAGKSADPAHFFAFSTETNFRRLWGVGDFFFFLCRFAFLVSVHDS